MTEEEVSEDDDDGPNESSRSVTSNEISRNSKAIKKMQVVPVFSRLGNTYTGANRRRNRGGNQVSQSHVPLQPQDVA